MTEIWLENRSHLVLISGQNDIVQSDIATKSDKAGVVEWLGNLLKD
jgi:hypothetical protein